LRTYQEHSRESGKISCRAPLSENDKAALMGGTLQKVYKW
jgi:hypothetical protein